MAQESVVGAVGAAAGETLADLDSAAAPGAAAPFVIGHDAGAADQAASAISVGSADAAFASDGPGAAAAFAVGQAMMAGQLAAAADESQVCLGGSAGVGVAPGSGRKRAAPGSASDALVPFDGADSGSGAMVSVGTGGHSGGASSGWTGQCWFECGTAASLLNIGNQR